MIQSEKGAIVIGGHVQGLGIIRILGRNGIPCFVLDTTSINIARHSKYCTKFIKHSGEDILEFLINLNKKNNLSNWLLIPTDDNHARILSQNKEELEKYYRVSVDRWDVIEKCYNKRITYKIVKELGVEIPDSYFPDDIKDLEYIDIEFPCIIKPAIMQKFYNEIGEKIIVCNNRKELFDNYKKILSHNISEKELIIQEIIPGDSDNQYSACFFFDKTKAIVSLVARRKRQYPIDFGKCSCFVETIHDDLLLDVAKKILEEIDFWGLCEVEFKKDTRDGKYKFLEINPRTWKWHSIGNVSESPFLMSLYNYIYFNEPIEKNEWNAACWKDLIIDSFVLFKSKLKKESEEISNKKIEYAVYDRDDLKPFIFEVIYAPYLFVTR